MKERNTTKFKIVEAEEGMRLTYWKEGDDIMDWSSCRMMYAPLTADTSVYREVTEQEAAARDEELQKLIGFKDGVK